MEAGGALVLLWILCAPRYPNLVEEPFAKLQPQATLKIMTVT